ncbi:MAG TPA: rRNA maturation RNase YbeY [Candidatus Paceibacterota bacterium]|nr:rRNA maturation RNase YbeY [Candidatus Paceibacterota bacterium]
MDKKFEAMKNDILGKGYSLSLASVDAKTSRRINRKYRGKDKPANVLSFPFSKTEGEIILCPETIKKQTKKFGRDFESLFGFMVIHGMLHLKGMQHSSKMEEEENKYDKKYLHRNRNRVSQNKSSSGRTPKRRKAS